MTALAPLLQAFFTDRLARQRDASPHTIAAYRDSFRLLLTFLHEQTGKAPSKLQLEDLDAARIAAFLAHLENERGNSVRTRNARLTAIHSFFHYAALKAPEQRELIARVLAIPEKRFDTDAHQLPRPSPRSTRCSPRRTAPPGPAGATTRCCCWPCRPGCEPPSSRACAAKTSSSAPAPGSDAKAKAERKGARPLSRPTRQVLHVWLRELGGDPAGPLFPTRSGPAPHPRRDLAAGRQTRRHRPRPVPLARNQEHHPARAASHRGDAAAARPDADRHRDDRAVARPRDARLHQQVPPRRHGTQTTRARPHHAHRTPNRAATAHPTRCSRSSRASRPPEICRADEPDPHRPPTTSRTQRNIVPRAT